MSTASDRTSVLFVDDDESVRAIVVWLLEDAGYAVHGAADAQEALDFLERHGAVDLVLSDVDMPGMDGVWLREELKRRWPNLPVILTSGRNLAIEAAPFLAKPFDMPNLLDHLHRMLARPDSHAA